MTEINPAIVINDDNTLTIPDDQEQNPWFIGTSKLADARIYAAKVNALNIIELITVRYCGLKYDLPGSKGEEIYKLILHRLTLKQDDFKRLPLLGQARKAMVELTLESLASPFRTYLHIAYDIKTKPTPPDKRQRYTQNKE